MRHFLIRKLLITVVLIAAIVGLAAIQAAVRFDPNFAAEAACGKSVASLLLC